MARSAFQIFQSHHARITNFRIDGTLAAHRRSVLFAFGGLGFHVGIWTVVLADIIAALRLSTGIVGLALAVLSIGGIVTLIAGGQIAHRIGHRLILVSGVAGIGCFFLLLANVETLLGLYAVFLFGGAAAGCYDLAVNSLGGDVERVHKRQQMTTFHAMFSFGAASGAIIAGLLLTVGWRYQTVLLLSGMGLIILSVLAVVAPLPAGGHTSSSPDPHRSRSPTWMVSTGVVFAAAIVVLAFLTDASLEGYISYYLRTLLGSGPLLGAAGIAIYYLAVALGRLGSGAMLRQLGEQKLIVGSGLGGAAGLLIAISTSSPPVASLGLLVVGVALSPVAPVAFSLAARSAPGREARAVSMVTIAAYGVFLLGPVIIGGLADVTSLRIAWLLPICALLGLSVAGWRAPARLLHDGHSRRVDPVVELPSAAPSKD